MKQPARYINHCGEEINLNGDGIYLNNGELPNWELDTVVLNDVTMALNRKPRDVPLEMQFIDDDKDHGLKKRTEFYRVTSKDTELLEKGRLYVGNWYLEGYFTSSSKEMYYLTGEYAAYSLIFRADDPRWTNERVQQFLSSDHEDLDGLDFPHDYPFDFTQSWFGDKVRNSAPIPAPAVIRVPGPTSEGWEIRIADNVYSCNLQLAAGELLEIDGEREAITLIDTLGAEHNVFSSRNGIFKEGSGSFIFEPVPSGYSTIMWQGCDGVEVTVFEKLDEWVWDELGWTR